MAIRRRPTNFRPSSPDRPGPRPKSARPYPGVVRTALCVRGARRAIARVHAADQSDWKTISISSPRSEATAAELSLPVIVEGYTPPHDHRLSVIKVTPDPGVIEVNVHSGAHLGRAGEYYDRPLRRRASTLGWEPKKFNVDGKHTGTGGGNHIVLGGATPGDSPFLRRPRSYCAACWPIGTIIPRCRICSPARLLVQPAKRPRVDEARHDALYELEIAMRQIPKEGLCAALVGGPVVPPFAGRLDRQYAPGRILHRQVVFARFEQRPLGTGRVSRV